MNINWQDIARLAGAGLSGFSAGYSGRPSPQMYSPGLNQDDDPNSPFRRRRRIQPESYLDAPMPQMPQMPQNDIYQPMPDEYAVSDERLKTNISTETILPALSQNRQRQTRKRIY